MSPVSPLLKIKILASRLLGYLIAAQTILALIIGSGHLDSFPEILRYGLLVLSGIGITIGILRQVAPIPADQPKGIIEAHTATVLTTPTS